MKMMMKIMLVMLVSAWITGEARADIPTVTAAQIQQYDGVAEGDRVRFTGICTVESARYGYATTVACDPGGGEWAAIDIYDRDKRLSAQRGQLVEVVGIAQEYYDQTQINCMDETEFPPQALPDWGTLPSYIEVTTNQLRNTEALESCIILIRNPTVLSNPDTYGNIAIDDGSGEGTMLLRKIDPIPAIGYTYDCLIGHCHFHWGERKIRPRDEGDWVCPGDATPTPPPQGTPTATPTGGCAPVLKLEFQDHPPGECFTGGRLFNPTWMMTNNCGATKSVDLYIALQVLDMFFFYPSFGEDMQSILVSIPDGETIFEDIIPGFYWPDGVGSLMEGLAFWGVMTTPGDIDLVGSVEMLEFCYN
jgi:hypothetical protein